MVTIADVAKAAGVSAATVSRVMNHSPLVAEATARAVRETIERLAYVPNQQARNLRRNESRTVLVLTPNITNPYYASVFDGINEGARALEYNLFLCKTEGQDREALLSEAIDSKRADGAILLQIDRDARWLQKYSDCFPIVQCCEYAAPCDTAHVSVDNYRAGYEATSFLVGLGRRKVGTISADNRVMSTLQRMRGYQDALADAGIPLEERYVVRSDESYTYLSSLDAARKILSQEDPPNALFCIGDSIAMAAVVAAGELGLSVPEDVSVVGFDDVIYTKMIHPYLTTMVQPCADLGRTAIEMLHGIMTSGAPENRNVILPHGFAVRESTCPLSTPGEPSVFSGCHAAEK